jgi:hypothetical protein
MTGISRLREQAMRIGPRESPRMPVLRTASLRPIFKREIAPVTLFLTPGKLGLAS